MITQVEICEDMACAIFNETALTMSSLILKEIKKKPKPDVIYLEECSIKSNQKFWFVTLYKMLDEIDCKW